MISELSITDDNYAVACALLQARFENKRCIMRARVQALHTYPARPQDGERSWFKEVANDDD